MRLWLIGAVFIAGCGSDFSDRGNRPANEYRWLLRYDVKTLDPAAINDWTTGAVLHYLFPSIGEVCKVEASGDNQTFIIKPGSYVFADGRRVSGKDIERTLERCLVPEVQSGLGSLFAEQIQGAKEFAEGKTEHLSGITVAPDGTLAIKLTTPDVAFASKLSNRSLGVVNADLVGLKAPIKKWIKGMGLGKFELKSYEPSREWIVDNGEESIKFMFVGDSAARKTQFDVDKADQAMFAAHEIGVVKGHPQLTNGGPTTLVYIQFNQKKSPFTDPLNRAAVAGTVKVGELGRILDNKVIPPRGFGSLSGLGRSAAIATPKVPRPFEFELVYADIGHANPVVEALVTQLLGKGIRAKARPMTSGGLIAANNRGDLQALFTGWQPDFEGPLNTIPYLFHSKSPENHTGYAEPETDRFINLAQQGIEPEEQISRALARIEANVPGVPLYIQRDLVLKRNEPPKPF